MKIKGQTKCQRPELTKTDKSSKILGGNTINEHIQEVLEHVKCWEMEMLNFYEFVGKTRR